MNVNKSTQITKKPNVEQQQETPIQSQTEEISKYIKSLTEQEAQTLEIAKSHLGTSFNIKKSIGFLEWKSKQQ